MRSSTILSVLLAGTAGASPLQPRQNIVTVTETSTDPSATPYVWNEGAVPYWPIHSSCNATLRAQLEKGLGDAVKLAQHAKEHLLRWGNESEFKQKYFGNGSTATAIGWYDRIVSADRTGILFRCDDPDENCATQANWAGHWRGANATQETVICPRSFQVRLPLEGMCGLGYTVAESPLNTYWGTDLMHRIFHVPKISEGVVEHYAEDYAGILELARTNATYSVIDSDTLQYFAVDVYAYDIAAPGVGCSGGESSDNTDGASSSSASSTSAVTPTTTTAEAPSSASAAAQECHTHADGALHCV